MKRIIIAILCAAMLLSGCGNAQSAPEGAAARVGDEYIAAELIEGDRLLGAAGSDREIAEARVLNTLMLLEAGKLGLAATQEEIAEFMVSQEEAWRMAEVKEQIEAMYEPLGIDFEEYKAMVLENAPNTIARLKLRDHYGQEYCDKNDLQFTKVNPPEGMEEYIEKQLQKLWDKYKGEYDIYIN